jgi:branched-chain amino acid aminotransferase
MIYLNGQYVLEQNAKLEHNDRGFLLSDGLFETIRCYDGSICNLLDHFERLKKSADDLGIAFSMPFQELQNTAYLLLEKNALSGKNASLRITLTRGIGPRGLLPPERVKSTLMITAFPFVSASPKSIKVVISSIRRNESSPLSKMKSLCYLDNILARQKAVKDGADDCILINTQGNAACGSVSNLFIVTPKGIITPRIEDGILPGITRKIVIDLCKFNDLPVYEESISEKDLMGAHEIFFTNRLIEIQPIAEINSKLINAGKIGKTVTLLKKLYNDYVLSQIESIRMKVHKNNQ